MTADAGPPLPTLDAASLASPVRRALADEAAEVISWQVEPLAYTVLTPTTGGVYRVRGHVRTRGTEQSWSVVIKIARSPAGLTWPSGRPIEAGWGTDPAHSRYWRREALAYRSGLLADLPGGLVAPHCFGIDDRDEATTWLWLEEVRETEQHPWPLDRYGLAARHLGQFNGTYLSGQPLPDDPWLTRRFLRAWSADYSRLDRIQRTENWAHPAVRRIFPAPEAERLLRLAAERDPLLAALERGPQTLCHLDPTPGNLLAHRDTTGREQTIALDWAFLGHGAPGEEAGHLVATSLKLDTVAMADATALREAVLAGYLAGLRDAGTPATIAQSARRNAAISAALRWVFITANDALRASLSGQEDYADPVLSAALTRFLLDWLDDERGSQL